MGDRIEGSDTGNDSPWASDVPAPPAPVEFTWANRDGEQPFGGTAQAGSTAPGAGLPPPVAVTPTGESSTRTAATAHASSRRRPAVITVAAVAVLAVIVGVLTFGRDDGGPAATGDDPVATEPVPEDGELPSVTEPNADDQTDVATPATTVAGGGQASADDPPEDVWRDETFVPPATLREFTEPMTLMVLGSDLEYREIDMQTGVVRAIALSSVVSDPRLVIGDTSTLITSYSGSSTLLRVGQPPIDTGLRFDSFEVLARPGRDEYAAFQNSDDDRATYEDVRIRSDGTVTISDFENNEIPPWSRRFSPTGEVLVSDAGGVYEIADDGTAERISTGFLFGSSLRHLLVKECSEVYECEYVLIDAATDERSVVTVGAGLSATSSWYSVQVSPDGSAARYISYVGSSGPVEHLVDLTTGDDLEFPAFSYDETSQVWAADSSGVFRTATTGGVEFVDRVTGDVTTFGEDYGRVQAVGVRITGLPITPTSAGPITSGLSLVALGRDGNIHQIDLDAGTVITTAAPPLASSAPAYLFPDSEGAIIASFDNVPSIRLDTSTGTATLGATTKPNGPMVVGPLAGTVWQPRERVNAAAELVVSLVDALGQPLGMDITVGATEERELLGSDGQGGVLVVTPLGGIYSMHPDGSVERLTNGEVIALGPTVAYFRECDEALVCGIFRLDRATGERGLIDAPALESAGGDASAGDPIGQSVSPDGDVVLVRAQGFGTDWKMVDLASGSAVSVPGVALASPLVWSADSQWAMYLSGDVLRVYDRAARSLRTMTTLPELKAFAAVPSNVVEMTRPVAGVAGLAEPES